MSAATTRVWTSPRQGSATSEHVPVIASPRSLAWRVFLTNAVVLIGVSGFYVLTPATISSPVATRELIVLVAAVAVTLFLNLILLDHAFRPLDELRRLMQSVDPLAPGRRLEIGRADEDVKALTEAFNAMLDRIETERRESARRALAAQEQERQRMARELHDELGQILTGVLLLMDEASKASPERAREVLEEAREAARGSIENVRRIVRDLRPEALDDLGLASALAALAAGFERQTGIRLDRDVPSTLPPLAPETELVIYRVAQEALTNVARHAGARRAALEVRRLDDQLEIAVHDDGDGFDGDGPAEGGLHGMRERALLVRGSVTVRSRLGRGTEVRLLVPLERAA